jgi:hypothetical protein
MRESVIMEKERRRGEREDMEEEMRKTEREEKNRKKWKSDKETERNIGLTERQK